METGHPITILCLSRYLSGGLSTTLSPKRFELKAVNFPFSQKTRVLDIKNLKLENITSASCSVDFWSYLQSDFLAPPLEENG